MRITEEFFRALPRKPGIYFMLAADGAILYIGKAKSLRARLMSYRNAKPGRTPGHIIERLTKVAHIKWQECRSETDAYLREGELIRAVRPQYNIAGNWPAEYFFIGVRHEEARVSFHLTSCAEVNGYRLFGCYKHRRKTKLGYSALLRLIYAAVAHKPRFSFPAKITRDSPPYTYALAFPVAWRASLTNFLAGKSPRLLHELTEAMLANDCLPPFMYASIQADLNIVRQFYRIGPRATRKLRLKHGVRDRLVNHPCMDNLIKHESSIRP